MTMYEITLRGNMFGALDTLSEVSLIISNEGRMTLYHPPEQRLLKWLSHRRNGPQISQAILFEYGPALLTSKLENIMQLFKDQTIEGSKLTENQSFSEKP